MKLSEIVENIKTEDGHSNYVRLDRLNDLIDKYISMAGMYRGPLTENIIDDMLGKDRRELE